MPLDWRFGAPWNWNLGKKSKKKPLPEGFVELYGEKPKWADFRIGKNKFRISYFEYKVIVVQWETKLKHYKGRIDVIPNGVEIEKFDIAKEIYDSWGMGEIAFYDSTYGIKGRFLDSNLPDYSFSLHHLVEFPQHVVAQYQIEQILREMPIPKSLHFFVPPGLSSAIVREDE